MAINRDNNEDPIEENPAPYNLKFLIKYHEIKVVKIPEIKEW